MRRLLIGVGLIFVLVVSSGRTLAAGTAEPQLTALLRERYAAMKAAMAARDSKAISALLAPGFESVDIGAASQTADQLVKGVSSLPQDPNKVSQTTMVSVELHGNVATVFSVTTCIK